MYIVNPEVVDVSKLYKCNKFIRDWLVYQKHFPVFGRSNDGNWYFVKNSSLIKTLEELPFYLKLINIYT